MASMSVTKTLTTYFNTGEGKRSTKEWMDELRALEPLEKRKLAEEVCAVTGNTLTAE
jgi:hypothetical protein